MGSKLLLRSHFKEKLYQALFDNRQTKSHLVCLQLEKLLGELDFFTLSLCLGVYDPLGDEVDWKESKLLKNTNCVYPRFVDKGVMDYAKLSEKEEYSSSFGIKLKSPSSNLKSQTPDIVLVPALAFDEMGYRLGRGAGYFDRYLSQFKGVSIGLAFKESLTKELPRRPHDERVDYVVSEEGYFKRT